MKLTFAPAALAALLAGAAQAQPAPRPVVYDGIAAPATIRVTSPAVRADGVIAPEYSGYGRNIPPAVAWSGQPAGTKSIVLLVQDPDGGGSEPVIHWVAYDIPAATTALARKTPNEPRLDKPQGMKQGPNSHGGVGWTGPHPPVGDPPHHYHLQVFALDRPLKLRPGATLDQVSAALPGRVIAKGETVFLFAQAPPAPPKG